MVYIPGPKTRVHLRIRDKAVTSRYQSPLFRLQTLHLKESSSATNRCHRFLSGEIQKPVYGLPNRDVCSGCSPSTRLNNTTLRPRLLTEVRPLTINPDYLATNPSTFMQYQDFKCSKSTGRYAANRMHDAIISSQYINGTHISIIPVLFSHILTFDIYSRHLDSFASGRSTPWTLVLSFRFPFTIFQPLFRRVPDGSFLNDRITVASQHTSLFPSLPALQQHTLTRCPPVELHNSCSSMRRAIAGNLFPPWRVAIIP